MKAHFCFRLFAHAFVLQLALLLLASMAPLCAQPVLQEWWRAPERMVAGQALSYLPNFFNGKGALALLHNEAGKTWLNRYPGDTLNIFSWRGGPPIYRGDFNGDKVIDYIDFEGYIYQGIRNGEPPNPEPVKYIPQAKSVIMFIDDIDNDGCDDMVFTQKGYMQFGLIRGNKNLTDLYSILYKDIIPSNQSVESKNICGIMRGEDDKVHILTYRMKKLNAQGYLVDSYELYSIDWKQDTAQATLVKVIGGDMKQRLYSGDCAFLKENGRARYMIAKDNSIREYIIFDMKNNSWKELTRVKTPSPTTLVAPIFGQFDASIDDDDIPEWYITYYDTLTVPDKVSLKIYKGGDTSFSKVLVTIDPTCHRDAITTIDDINGDGRADMALGSQRYASLNCLRFYTLSLPTTIGGEYPVIRSDSPVPHPLHDKGYITLSLALESMIRIEAYPLMGGKDTYLIYQGMARSGTQTFLIDVSAVPSGIYLLRIKTATDATLWNSTIIVTH
jgi:hypothetical protein